MRVAERDTREVILQRAEDLLRSRGYNGFSYKDLAVPLGIRNAAIHYYFPTKTDLGLALIDRYRQLLHRRTGRFMRGEGGDPVIQLEAYFRFTLGQSGQDCRHICPIGSVAASLENVPVSMQDQARLLAEETRAWLERVCDVGRRTGQFRFEGTPADRAALIMAALQGALQLARLQGREVLEATIRQIRLDLHLPG